jgi:hypothetical protein
MMSNFEDKRRAEAQRVADQDHRKQIESEVANTLDVLIEFDCMDATELMEAIRDEQVPHVKIEY